MNFKGQNRRMFRKPGAAKRALGILASSQNLMNAVEPVRMQDGGSARIEQLQQQLNSLIQQRQRLNDIPASSINPLTGAPRVIASGIMERRDLAASTLDRNIAQLKQQLVQEMAAVGRPVQTRPVQASPQMETSYFDPTRPSPGEGLRPKSSPDDSILDRFGKYVGSGLLSTAQLPFNAVKGARTIGRGVESVLTEPGGADSFGDSVGGMSARADQLQVDNAKELAQKAGVLPAEKKSPEPSTDDLTSALNKLGESSPEKDTSTADLFLRIGLSIAAGQDRNALTNIAAGTLAALQESEKIGLLKDRQRPKIQETLDYFKTAGLNENEVQAILPYALGTTKRDSESERVVADMQAAAQRGDVAALTTILLQQQGQNADTTLAREQAEALIEQFSGVGSKN